MSHVRGRYSIVFFFFNDTATTEIYTLSLHDALPIFRPRARIDRAQAGRARRRSPGAGERARRDRRPRRSEEHTSELQSRLHLVCRLLLEKKKNLHVVRVVAPQGNIIDYDATLTSIPS